MRQCLALITLFLLLTTAAPAQCVVCTKTASELDDSSAKGLNGGIIYLAAIPLVLMGTVGYIWWKQNRNISRH